MKKNSLLSCVMAAGLLPGCYQGVVDDFEKLEGREVEVSDEEIADIVLDLQVKLLDGKLPLNALDNVARVLGISRTITVPLADFTLSAGNRANLQAKLDTYESLTSTALREDGFVEGCDSLLFTGLLSTSDFEVDITQAESPDEEGKWYRNPDQDECYTSGEAKSTISRDMMVGLAYSLWQMGDDGLEIVERTLAYAKANKWFIGEAENEEERRGRAFMSPPLAALYYEMQYKLGGDEHDPSRGMIQYYDPRLDGFRAHLDMLTLLLRGHLRGGLSKSDFAPALVHAKREPRNLFYAAVVAAFTDGDMNDVAESLLETTLFPTASLPTNQANYCTEYLWQRDYSEEDWEPCADEDLETYSGADFIFLANLVLGNLRRVDEVDPDFAE